MSRKSHIGLFNDWESLVQACRAHQAKLPGLNQVLDPLADAMVQMKALKVARKTFTTTAQEITQSVHESRDAGLESARRLRSFVRSQLGTRSEELPQFGIAPLGARSGSRKRKR
jgi:selenophosphate synthase